MQTTSRPMGSEIHSAPLPGKRRPSPFLFISIGLTLLVVLGAGIFFFANRAKSTNAAAANPNCTLIAPANPLSAQGLATPWQLVATDPNQGPCNQSNPNQTTFVQGAVIDPATGQISIYDPLVVDKGTQPAAQPVVPTLPQGAIVALWGGTQAASTTLQGANLQASKCVNGLNGSVFGQFWYCNAPAFFAAANAAIRQGKLKVPAMGMARDGMNCPTVSDFSIVDMDPHDNVTTTYLVTGDGKTAQMNAANVAALQNAQPAVNASDERLLSVAVDGALGCVPWMAPNLADPGKMEPALPLNEIQAALFQPQPQALIPNLDPMVLVNNQRNLQKLNLYRVAVNEPVSRNSAQSNTHTYCSSLRKIAPNRLMVDANLTMNRPSPDAAAANSLFTFLAQRFNATYGPNGLNCAKLLGQPSPITLKMDNNGVTIAATINGMMINSGNGGNPGGNGGGNPGPAATPDCVINGTAVPACAGTITINGQQCILSFANNTVNVNCPTSTVQPIHVNGGGTAQPGPIMAPADPQSGNAGKQNVNVNGTKQK